MAKFNLVLKLLNAVGITINPAVEETQQRRLGGGKTPVVATVTAAGDTDVRVPATGKALRVFWVCAINDPAGSSSPQIKIKLGTKELYRAWAVAHWEVFDGAVDEKLTVNLSAVGTVLFTAHVDEFTPP